MIRKIIPVFTVFILISSGGISILLGIGEDTSVKVTPMTIFSNHSPIVIDGDSNFTSANGVTGGSGTESDPYIIEDYNISAYTTFGIFIRNTTAHFVIRNVTVHSGEVNFSGIYIYNVTNGRLENSTLYDNYHGIEIEASTNFTVVGNNISSNIWAGIRLYLLTFNCVIKNNNIVDNDIGVYIFQSFFNLVEKNNFNKNGIGVSIYTADNNTILRNNFLEDSIGVKLETISEHNFIDYNNFTGNPAYGVFLFYSSNNYIRHNNFTNNSSIKIRIYYESNYNNVTNNNFYDTGSGINIEQNSNNNISGNNFFETSDGIYLYISNMNKIQDNSINDVYDEVLTIRSSLDNHVINNTLRNCSQGITFVYSSYNIIKSNDIASIAYRGLGLHGSSYNEIINNEISDAAMTGLYIENSCYENNITQNNISDCYNGGLAISLYSMKNNFSYNKIYNNDYGILSSSSDYNKYKFNNVSNNEYRGIRLSHSSACNLENNTVNSNGNWGLEFYFSNYNIIRNSTFSNNNWSGIWMNRTRDCVIENNNLSDNIENGIGIYRNSIFNKIKYNTVRNNKGNGILLKGRHYQPTVLNEIGNNTVQYNDKHGLYMEYSDDNNIHNNTVSSNQMSGLFIYASDNNWIHTNQIFENGKNGIRFDYSDFGTIDNNLIHSNSEHGIELVRTDKIHIKNNILSVNELDGINLDKSDGNSIFNNTCVSNYNGIWLFESRENEVLNNWITKNEYCGVYMDTVTEAAFNIISNNNISYSKEGISFHLSDYNDIIDNYISLNDIGINLIDSDYNLVSSNSIIANHFYGIHFGADKSANSRYNKIINNGIKGNKYGMKIEGSYSNFIVLNSFIANLDHIITDTSSNIWNDEYPKGGNYWDNYHGADEYYGIDQSEIGRDGLGDEPYIINDQNKDNYPLMDEYVPSKPSTPINLNATSGYNFVKITWANAFSDGFCSIEGYHLYRSTNPNPNMGDFFKTITNQLYYNDTSVQSGLTYYYKIDAFNDIGVSDLSDQVIGRPGSVPGAPRNIIALADTDRITVSWDPPHNDGGFPVTNYLIYKGISSGNYQNVFEVSNIYYYPDTGVTKGIIYYYRVRAVNALGEGPVSEETNVSIETAPTAPLNLTASAGNSYVNLSWKKPASDGGSPINGYWVYRRTNSEDEAVIVKIWGEFYFFNDTDVTNGVTYYYRVQALNDIGASPFSIEISAKPIYKPNINPKASIGANVTIGPPPLTVAFMGSGTDADGKIVSYQWYFDDGNSSYEQNPVHTFAEPGIYSVRLTVYDDDGDIGIALRTITVVPARGDEPPEPESEKEKDDGIVSTPWAAAAGATIIAGIIVMVLLMLFLPALLQRREKVEPVEPIMRKRVVKQIQYKRTLMVPRLRVEAEQQIEDEEAMEEE